MRTIIQITGFNGTTFEAVIPGMNITLATIFPLNIIPEHLHKFVNPGQRFFARVSETNGGINITDFEIAPAPDPNDGLG